METSHLTAHALAMWAQHAGTIHQQDKDFFDSRISRVAGVAMDEKDALFLLLTARLISDGIKQQQAEQKAKTLTDAHAQRWLRQMPLSVHDW